MKNINQAIADILKESYRMSKINALSEDYNCCATEILVESIIDLEPLKDQSFPSPDFGNIVTIVDAFVLSKEDNENDLEELVLAAVGVGPQELPDYLLAQCQNYSAVLHAREAVHYIAMASYHLDDEHRQMVLQRFSSVFTDTDLLGDEAVEEAYSKTVNLMRESPSFL